MSRFLAILFPLALVLSACSIHPLPEDVTRETTSAIVEQIRCEGRQALDNLTVDLLRKNSDTVLAGYAAKIEAGTLKATDLLKYKSEYELDRLDKKDLQTFLAYTLSAVTFDFQFMMTETNDNSANFDLAVPFVSRVFNVNGQAEAKFQRQNTRKFFVTNSFYELHDQDFSACVNKTAKVGDVIYPITGKIGLEEVFRTFITIDQMSGSTKKPEKKEELFTDSLLFTTTLSASVTPKITLNPVTAPRSGLLRVPDAAITASAQRIDAHQVAISLARGDVLKSYAQALASGKPYYDQVRSNAKKKALAIAQQNRVNFFFINQRAIYNQLNINSPYGY